MSAVINPLAALTKYFESAEQTITVAGLLTLAHGFGVMPKAFQLLLVCKTAEDGFAVNDELLLGPAEATMSSGSRGISLVPDATNLNIRIGSTASPFEYQHYATGANAAITIANWKIKARAWA